MVATAATVRLFLEHHKNGHDESRLGVEIRWDHKDPLIQSHRHGVYSSICHVQQLHSVGESTLETDILRKIESHPKPGFIFVGPKLRHPCEEPLELQSWKPPSTTQKNLVGGSLDVPSENVQMQRLGPPLMASATVPAIDLKDLPRN
jgi:hypothetical protein